MAQVIYELKVLKSALAILAVYVFLFTTVAVCCDKFCGGLFISTITIMVFAIIGIHKTEC